LGLYLRRFVGNLSWGKTLAVALPAWLVGFAICFGGFIVMVMNDAAGQFPIEGPTGLAAAWETTWINDTAGVFLMTIGWILVFRKINAGGWFYRTVLLPISKASYGMYLCHMIALAFFSGWLRESLGTGVNGQLGIWTTPVQILLTALITFATVALFCVAVQRIPKLGKWVVG
jgi:peptidoglycan/LPS O-acetylase OafA/YrhL